jgi:hypothetical protein
MRTGQDVDAVVREAGQFHAEQAFAVLDRFLAAKDPATGLPPLHVRTANGRLVATDHFQSGLDTGRLTAGLVMAPEVAKASGDQARAARYLAAAEDLWMRARRLLTEGYVFVQRWDFNANGSVKSRRPASTERARPARTT